jgi:ABC-type multidrug transport system permease subunit
MFNSALPALVQFPSERPRFLREYYTGTYSSIPYSLGKVLIDIPLGFMQAVLQTLIVYWSIRLQGDILYIILCVFGTSMASSSLAVFFGCINEDPNSSIEMVPLLFVPQILFTGFFIRTSLIPIWMRWIQYLCPLKYGMNLFLMNEFAAFRKSCQGQAGVYCEATLTNNDIVTDDWWVYVLVLASLFLMFRVVAMVALVKKANSGI